jgi:hypothetical protein
VASAAPGAIAGTTQRSARQDLPLLLLSVLVQLILAALFGHA